MTSGTSPGLRVFSKGVCLATLFLIFAGGLVTSTGSGLAIPDWPLSYGSLFPPMVGGVFYEHGHRMAAAAVGALTVCLALWLWSKEKRRWVRTLGVLALLTVIGQGVLGGLTVLFFLPTSLSVMHGVLAQAFFILTILIAYSQSSEGNALEGRRRPTRPDVVRFSVLLGLLIYLQLILGALMRHTGSGLAIPDFPKAGGFWVPPFDEAMLSRINGWRFDMNLAPVDMGQVAIHFVHRLGALAVAALTVWLNVVTVRGYRGNRRVLSTLLFLDGLMAAQLLLGISTVLTQKSVVITTLHVATGAALLGASVLFILRVAPVSLREAKRLLLP